MSTDQLLPSVAPAPMSGGRAFASTRAKVSLTIVIVIALGCLAAPITAPYDPIAQPDIIGLRSSPPSLLHPFGTDAFSRDVFSRVVYGGRVSLGIALAATLVSVTVGTLYGLVAGYAGGLTETIMMRVLDALLSIPRLLLLIAIFAFWQPVPLPAYMLVIGASGWYVVGRIVRGQVLALKQRDFVTSARALGAGSGRIILSHILPNLVTPVIVAAAIGLGHVIILEAGLSYLGVGVRQPVPSWGNIIQDGAGDLAGEWWVYLFPGLAIVVTVMAFNILADALREHLDPHGGPSR